MHILNLSRRNGRAQERLLAAAKAFARVADIDPALIHALTPNVKDPAVRMMKEREAVADLLEALAIATGVPLTEPAGEEDVTTVTDIQSSEPESKPMDDTIPGPTPLNDVQAESGETLPPPVLEETTPARAAGGMINDGALYTIAEPDPLETFVPTEPAAEEKSKSAKKRTGKK